MKPSLVTSRDRVLLLVVLVGLAGVAGLSRLIDEYRPPADSAVEEEKLYLTGKTMKRASFAFNGLMADWYWMRSLQYVGRKLLERPESVQLEDLGQLNLRLLAPLLDTATTLDPEFIEPYEYAAIVLPAIDVPAAIQITKKGIAANPTAWRLYQHLGYLYWQQRDFKTAGEVYDQGAKLPGAPVWMEAMKARMATEGGSRNTAREIYLRMHEQSDDKVVKEMARRRLLQLDSLEIQDALRKLLLAHKAKSGRCPASWREMQAALTALKVSVDSNGAPLDPAGTPYLLVKGNCDVESDWRSEVPFK
ncbi:MAG: tetratricopeptide repeat protein [Pyrinomonadaceae bacterium]